MRQKRMLIDRLNIGAAIRGIFVDAALGAVCGALYGASFGSFGIRIHGDLWKMLPIVGVWALCIASISVLVGALSRSSKFVGSSELPPSTIENVAQAARELETRQLSRRSPPREKTVTSL